MLLSSISRAIILPRVIVLAALLCDHKVQQLMPGYDISVVSKSVVIKTKDNVHVFTANWD